MRDGCYGQISAAEKIDVWAKGKGRTLLLAKYSAGCSMTESMNDLKFGHSGLHAAIASSDFKCEQRGDPPGALYAAAKKYLSQHLAPASFKTFWKLISAFEPFVLRAMNPQMLLSAAKLAGFDGEGIDTRRIMSHNLEFVQIQPPAKAEEVLALIDTVFAPYWARYGLIHENIFGEIFDGEANIDTLSDRAGKPLNDMATNRQRFMLDNHESWKAVLERRALAEELAKEEVKRKQREREAADAAKPAKSRECSVLGCACLIDITTASLKRVNENTWRKCSGKGCATWGCPAHLGDVIAHEAICRRVLAAAPDVVVV